jgi:hypothetical protein
MTVAEIVAESIRELTEAKIRLPAASDFAKERLARQLERVSEDLTEAAQLLRGET